MKKTSSVSIQNSS